MTASSTPGRPCPICRKPAQAEYKPFCSKRCADVDLGRWLTGGYVIPGEGGAEADQGAPSTDDEG